MADPIVDAILSNQQNRDFWQGTLRNLVQTIAQIPQMREQALERQALVQDRFAQAQDRQAMLQERQQKAADLKQMDQLLASPDGRQTILDRTPGHLRPTMIKIFQDSDESALKYQKTLKEARQIRDDSVARRLMEVRDVGNYSPESAQMALSEFKQRYPDDQEFQGQLQRFEQQLHQNPTPDFVKKVIDPMLMQSEEARKALEAQQKAEKGALDITAATQKTTGTEPIQPAQQATIDAQARTAERAEAAQRSTEAYQKTMAEAAMKRANRPPSAAERPVRVEHKDPATGKTVIQWLLPSQIAGQTFEKGTGATTENRLASAQAVTQTGNDIISQLSDPKVAALVGPAMGRYNSLREFIGNPPPELSELAGLVESYSLANMGVHGMRSVQGSEKIKALLDAKHTPESLIRAIRGLNGFSQHFLENEGRQVPGATTAPTNGGAVPSYQDYLKSRGKPGGD